MASASATGTMTARGGRWVALQMVAGGAVVLVARRAPQPPTAATARRVVAVGVGALGAVVALGSARRLGPAAFTVFPRPRPGAPLAAHGPYRVVRHPMYASVLAFAVAVATDGSPWAFVPAATLAIVLDRKAAREEAWLTEARPEYATYRAAVRWRFLPGVR
jgi:protein-S-isoprenylcysteine O-methyltransferase Ste14